MIQIKTILNVITGLSIIVAGVYFFPKEAFETHDSIITVMNDVTEKDTPALDGTQIFGQLNLTEEIYNGATFRFINLNDVSLNSVVQLKLNSAPRMLSNEISRGKIVDQFEDSLYKLFGNNIEIAKGKDYSSIYIPIAKELGILSNSKADRKILIVYSDLIENSEVLSLYTNGKNGNLIDEPSEVIEIFSKVAPLPRLDGVQIYLIYQPKNKESDKLYEKISIIYSTLLLKKGAKVYVQAEFLLNE